MDKYFFHYFRVGDFEVPKYLFESLCNLIEEPDCKGNRKFYLTYKRTDEEPNIFYVYAWSRYSDFLYLGHIEKDPSVDLPL